MNNLVIRIEKLADDEFVVHVGERFSDSIFFSDALDIAIKLMLGLRSPAEVLRTESEHEEIEHIIREALMRERPQCIKTLM